MSTTFDNHIPTVHSSKLNSIEDARIFLLGENHCSEECIKINAQFILDRVQHAVGEAKALEDHQVAMILLVEGPESMTEVKDKKLAFDRLHIDPSIREYFKIFGWDKKRDEESDRFFRMTDAIRQVAKKHQEDPNFFSETDRHAIAKQITSVDEERNEYRRKSFPERTQAMVKTLQKLKEMDFDKAFFIAGASHLETVKTRDEGDEFSLKPLHDEIRENQESAAIFIPFLLYTDASSERECAK